MLRARAIAAGLDSSRITAHSAVRARNHGCDGRCPLTRIAGRPGARTSPSWSTPTSAHWDLDLHPVPEYGVNVTMSEGDDTVSLTNSRIAPDACTLPTAEQSVRLAELDALFTNHTKGVVRIAPTQLVLTLTGPPDLAAQLKDLTDRESSCCSFFTFTVSTKEDSGAESRVRLEVVVPAARVDVLDVLAERAGATRESGPE
jgi:hypothetical protein